VRDKWVHKRATQFYELWRLFSEHFLSGLAMIIAIIELKLWDMGKQAVIKNSPLDALSLIGILNLGV